MSGSLRRSDLEFDGKVALVTGAASGIGRATALAFGRSGARVVVNDIDDEGGSETVRLIEAAGHQAHFIHADVGDETAVAAMIAEIVRRYGRLDCAFNNAGVSGGGYPEVFWDSSVFAETFAINASGVFYCMKHEVEHMLTQEGGGTIVNMASVAGMAGPGQPSYMGSKHAVIGMTRAVAVAYAAQGIRVNAVCPGAIDTPLIERVRANSPASAEIIANMHPMARIGQPNEVAGAVLFLCSARASFITGHPLAVDGGYLAR